MALGIAMYNTMWTDARPLLGTAIAAVVIGRCDTDQRTDFPESRGQLIDFSARTLPHGGLSIGSQSEVRTARPREGGAEAQAAARIGV